MRSGRPARLACCRCVILLEKLHESRLKFHFLLESSVAYMGNEHIACLATRITETLILAPIYIHQMRVTDGLLMDPCRYFALNV